MEESGDDNVLAKYVQAYMVRRHTTYIFLLLMVLTFGNLDRAVAQIYDADGQYVDTVFHDHVNRQADDFVRAYVAIASPGTYLYTILGHAAYHVVCPAFGLDYYFSAEGENSPDQVLRFVVGKLKMGMLAIVPDEYLSWYAQDNRRVTEWELNLTPKQKQRLWQVLDTYVVDWQGIPYDYYHRCCALTVVNIMHEALSPDTITYAQPWPERFQKTVRELVRDNTQDYPWTQMFICFLAGTEVDKNVPAEQRLIIPQDVVDVWKTAMVNGRPLLTGDSIVTSCAKPQPPVENRTLATPLAASLFFLLLSVLAVVLGRTGRSRLAIVAKVIDVIELIVVTAIGVFMTYLIFISNLCCTDWNWLIVVFNPLPAVFWYWRRYWALPYAAVMLVWVVVMALLPHAVVLPPHIVFTVAWILVLLRQVPWKSLSGIVKSNR